MDDLKSWWEISQLAGAGAAFVLGPAAWLLWRRIQDDTAYIREMDKATIKVLSELTTLLTRGTADAQTQHGQLLRAVEASTSQIKDALTDGQNPRQRRQ